VSFTRRIPAWLAAAYIGLLAAVRPASAVQDLLPDPPDVTQLAVCSYIVELTGPPIAAERAAIQTNSNGKGAATACRTKLRAEHAAALKGINVEIRKHRGRDASVLYEYFNVFNGVVLEITQVEADQIKALPGVKAVYPDLEVRAMLQETVTDVRAIDAWNVRQDPPGAPALTGRGTVIAIIDTGVDYTHPDLGGGLGSGFKVIGGYDFVNKDADPMDDMGHGTHVAGVAAGKGDYNHNGAYEPQLGEVWGVAPDASILAYKVLNESGSGSTGSIIAALDRALDPNGDGDFADRADVANLSLGTVFGGPDDAVSRAADRAVDAGMVVVASAGNSGPAYRTISSPAAARKVIAVGAVYKQDYTGLYWQDQDPRRNQIVSFSSRGPGVYSSMKPDLVAPGALIGSARYDHIYKKGKQPYYGPYLDKDHVQLAGTSMAAPVVAGAAALVRQAQPHLSAGQVKANLIATAGDLGYSPFVQGAGLVDALAAVGAAEARPVADIELGALAFKKGEALQATVTAQAESFREYRIYYAPAEDYRATGPYTLIHTGTSPVERATVPLAIDTSALADWQQILVKLEVESVAGVSTRYSYAIFPDYMSGFPVSMPSGVIRYPAIARLQADGPEALLLNHYSMGGFQGLRLVDLAGTQVAAMPDSALLYFPAIADLDADGSKDITVAGRRGTCSVSSYDAHGRMRPGWPVVTADVGFDVMWPLVKVIDTPAGKRVLAHRNVDGIWRVASISPDGSNIINYEAFEYPILYSYLPDLPLCCDVDGDGQDELVGINGKWLVACELDGSPNRWRAKVGTAGGLVAGDLEGDGEVQIVARYEGDLHCVDVAAQRVRWSRAFGAASRRSFQTVLSDVTGDGVAEILFWQDGVIYVVDAWGNLINRLRTHSRNGYFYNNYQILTTDVDGDGINEIIYGGDDLCIYKVDGTCARFDLGLTMDAVFPLVGDFDGGVEAFVFQCDPLIGLGGAPNKLIGLKLPYPYKASRNHWPLVHYDPANSNVYNGHLAAGCHGADINRDGRIDVSQSGCTR
jgi:subtilisin family serine protease